MDNIFSVFFICFIAFSLFDLGLSIKNHADFSQPSAVNINMIVLKIIAFSPIGIFIQAPYLIVLTALLLAIGASLKIPLVTPFVTIMKPKNVSMTQSALEMNPTTYRLKGIINAIGTWCLTMGIAFVLSYVYLLTTQPSNTIITSIILLIAAFSAVMSVFFYRNKKKHSDTGLQLMDQVMDSSDNAHILSLLQNQLGIDLDNILQFVMSNVERTVTGFTMRNLRGLRMVMKAVKDEKVWIKQNKRIGTVALCKLNNETIMDKGIYYSQCFEFSGELVYSTGRMCQPCLEHLEISDENLNTFQKGELVDMCRDVVKFLNHCRAYFQNNESSYFEKNMHRAEILKDQLSHLKREELKRIQDQSENLSISMVYLKMIQEAEIIVSYAVNLMKVSRKFKLSDKAV